MDPNWRDMIDTVRYCRHCGAEYYDHHGHADCPDPQGRAQAAQPTEQKITMAERPIHREEDGCPT